MTRLALPLSLAAVLLVPAAAHATDFCVAPNATCGGTNVATLQEALDAADNDPDADRVFLGAATYTAPVTTGFDYDASASPVEIIGAGAGQTALTGPAGTTRVLRLQGGAGSLVRDISIVLPASVPAGAIGMDLSDTATRVNVTAHPTQANQHRGVDLRAGGAFLDGGITLTQNIGNVVGVLVFGTTDGLVARSTISARTGVSVNPSAAATVDRTTATSTSAAVETAGGSVTVRSSVLRPVNGGSGLFALDQPGSSATINANGLTIVGDDTAGTDGAVASESFAMSVTVNVTNSVIRDVQNALGRFSGGGLADVVATFSNFDPATSTQNAGAGTLSPPPGQLEPGSNVNVDPLFVDPAADFRLQAGSPLVDRGDPGTSAGFDFDGNALVVDGDGDGTARRDIGAFERPAPAPPAGGGGGGGGGGTEPPPGGGTSPPPAGDTTAPSLTALAAGPARIRRGRGTRFSFSLSEAATATIDLRRARGGRRVGGTCRRETPRNRRARRCTRYVQLIRLVRSAVEGRNSIRFDGRIGGRAIPAGRYRVVVTAIDAAGNRSVPVATTLTVLPR